MEFHYLDLLCYIIICVIAWFLLPPKAKEGMHILGWYIGLFLFTIIWIIVFIYPIDLNISELFIILKP